MKKIFYVYEHWRPDTDVPFYVGKGHGNRANCFVNRNVLHRSVRRELSRQGMCIEVRLVRSELSERQAFAVEIERIAFWRNADVWLANMTDGGEGPAGIVFSEQTLAKLREKRKHRVFTAKDRAAMSAGRIGMKFSESHRANLAARKAGKPRKAFTQETKEKMRAASLKREQAKRDKYGSEVRRNSRIKVPGFS